MSVGQSIISGPDALIRPRKWPERVGWRDGFVSLAASETPKDWGELKV